MSGRNKRRKKRLNFKVCFVAVLIIYISVAIIGQQSKIDSLNQKISDANALISEKEKEYSALEDQEKVYGSDEYVEHVARKRLGYVRPDETVFVDVTGK